MVKEMTWARANYLTREIRRLAFQDDTAKAKSAKRLEALRAELGGPYWELLKNRE